MPSVKVISCYTVVGLKIYEKEIYFIEFAEDMKTSLLITIG